MNSKVSEAKPSHNEPFTLQIALVLGFCGVLYLLYYGMNSYVESRQMRQIQTIHRR